MANGEEPNAEEMVRFCRFLRDRGFAVGVTETIDSIQASRIIGVENEAILRLALRSALCSSKDQWDRFDELFETFWKGDVARPRKSDNARRPEKKVNSFWVLSGASAESSERSTDEHKTLTGASKL